MAKAGELYSIMLELAGETAVASLKLKLNETKLFFSSFCLSMLILRNCHLHKNQLAFQDKLMRQRLNQSNS